MALGLGSQDAAGNRFGTQSYAFEGGLKARIPLGDHEVGLVGGYGREVFELEVPAGAAPLLPGVRYDYLRAGLDARFMLGSWLGLRARGAYRHIVSSGDIGSAEWFPRSAVGGVDAGLGVIFPIAAGLEGQLGFELRRYFYALRPEPGDPHVAGGALDQYLTGTLALGWSLGR